MVWGKQAISTVVTFVVVVVIIAAAIFYVAMASGFTGRTASSQYETTSSLVGQNVTLVGTCSVTTYYWPDTEEVYVTNVTTVYNGTTTHYLSTYSTSRATIETIGRATYTTSTTAEKSITYVITTTSTDSNAIPSARWSVTVCTFIPQG